MGIRGRIRRVFKTQSFEGGRVNESGRQISVQVPYSTANRILCTAGNLSLPTNYLPERNRAFH